MQEPVESQSAEQQVDCEVVPHRLAIQEECTVGSRVSAVAVFQGSLFTFVSGDQVERRPDCSRASTTEESTGGLIPFPPLAMANENVIFGGPTRSRENC
jgi:hypothetical protein